LSNNIARHGKPGEYLFRVGLGNGSFGILASNLCKDEQELSGESRGVGLRLITRTVEQLGGDIQTNTDDGEWTIAIRVSTDEDA
jgi:two-component sensor histidine kinase